MGHGQLSRAVILCGGCVSKAPVPSHSNTWSWELAPTVSKGFGSADPREVTARGLFCFSSMITNIIPLLSSERDLSGRGGVRQGQLCTSADTTVCLAMKASMPVFKVICLPPFGKHLSFLLLSGLVGGAGLRCKGSSRGGIAAPLALPDLPVIQKQPHSLLRVPLT